MKTISVYLMPIAVIVFTLLATGCPEAGLGIPEGEELVPVVTI